MTDIVVTYLNERYKHFDWYASQLELFNVDYDVFAASYYPYWHGSLNGFETSLQNIIDKYEKKFSI